MALDTARDMGKDGGLTARDACLWVPAELFHGGLPAHQHVPQSIPGSQCLYPRSQSSPVQWKHQFDGCEHRQTES